ncbi:hypothetical protein QJQ45_001173 [Haematococcus lacustris]|nr:hypothetical protein QJQ45_001173 [Haematococcus lacustris]
MPCAGPAAELLVGPLYAHIKSAPDLPAALQRALPDRRAAPEGRTVLRHLRFLLALAKQLNRTLVWTGIKKHYTDRTTRFHKGQPPAPQPPPTPPAPAGSAWDSLASVAPRPRCFREVVPDFIQLSEVLDRRHVEGFVDVITPDELRAEGWDGVVDALLYPHCSYTLPALLPYLSMTLQASGGVMHPDAAQLDSRNHLRCDPQEFRDLALKLRPHTVVVSMLVLVAGGEMVDLAADAQQPRPPLPGCWQDLWEAKRRLRGNLWLRSLATVWAQRFLGPAAYLALHIRPQSDVCINYWKARKFEVALMWADGACWRGHEDLHLTFAARTRAALLRHNLTSLFVMAHPKIRPFVSEQLLKVRRPPAAPVQPLCLHPAPPALQASGWSAAVCWLQEGLRPTFMDETQLAGLAGCSDRSSTFLALVEMQVAVHASVLLGTAASSITETVVYERLSLGMTSNEYVDRPHSPRPPPRHPPAPPPGPIPAGQHSRG